MIHNLNQPRLRIPMRIKFRKRDDERFLHNVASVFLVEPMLPGRTPNQRQEIPSVKLVESSMVA